MCSETSAYKIRTLENHPKERIQHSKPCLWLEKTCVIHFPVLENDINTSIYVYREFCVIVVEGEWYMDGNEWVMTAADGHLALLASECHLNVKQSSTSTHLTYLTLSVTNVKMI